ncbi:MAG: class I SAM-dependent rRNA methyltransferase [Myxococcales bacterium]|nr:class I SAM-dependent rRNA methyltransferase [Myxococcales bacterium]
MYPVLMVSSRGARRVAAGHPWVFQNEVHGPLPDLEPGALVNLAFEGGGQGGTAMFNPRSMIVARRLDVTRNAVIDLEWLTRRFTRCLRMRETWFATPHYRLVHGEADGLPGLVVDRFGDAVTVQCNTAAMDRLAPDIAAALRGTLGVRTIVFRNDSPVRRLEGLDLHVRVEGEPATRLVLQEHGASFEVDLFDGQKTGWFYDQRANRMLVAKVAAGKSVADFYTYAGGFAVQAARAGASSVLAVDRSEHSLELARQSAVRNQVDPQCEFVQADAIEEMGRRASAGQRFDVVIADPPAFAKQKKDIAQAAAAYRRMARSAATLTAPAGWLFTASCSHHMSADMFWHEVSTGIHQAGRSARAVWTGGADIDHPTHPFLPESSYLKGILWALDDSDR